MLPTMILMLRGPSALGAVLFIAMLIGMPCEVRAEPQASAGLTIGGALVGNEARFFDHGEFHLGARGDVLFGRDRGKAFGFGPYAELGTLAFDSVQFGGGVSALLPVHEDFPLVFSAGALAMGGGSPFQAGLSGSLFFGVRSYNFHAPYGMANGVLLSYRHSVGGEKLQALLLTAQLDVALLSLPLVALVSWVRGPSSDARGLE